MNEYNLKIIPELSGKRLDLALSEFVSQQGVSRTSVQKAILSGKVLVNGKKIDKPNYKVKIGEDVLMTIVDKKPNLIEGEDIPLKVVFEDSDLAVIDKQVGLVVHPAPGNYKHTLVNALLHRFGALSDINPLRPGIVHRLDKDTSGILVIAKNNVAHLNLAKQFAEHSIKRRYVALVNGRMDFDENIIEVPIGRHPQKRESMAVGFGKKTRYAKTHYRTLKRTPVFSLVELEPFTGRTHQLRVHLAFIGHPILGDVKYGQGNSFSRLALHAKYIGFIHPSTGKFIEFFSPTPQEFTDFINK